MSERTIVLLWGGRIKPKFGLTDRQLILMFKVLWTG